MKEKWIAFRSRYGGALSPALFLFTLFALDFSFRAIYAHVAIASVWHLTPNTFTLCWGILFTVAAILLPGLLKKIWMGVVLFFSAFLPLVHAVIHKVTDNFLAFSDLAFAEDGVSFMSIEYLRIPWQMYFFSVILTAVGVFAIILAPKKQTYPPLKWGLSGVAILVSVITIAAQHNAYDISTNKRFTWLDTYDPTSIQAIYTDFTNANECLIFCGGPQYTFQSLTQGLTTQLNRAKMMEKLDEYYGSHQKTCKPNEMTGLFRGKNVICILGESIDTWLLDERIMPNLYALQQQSIDFTDHYTPLFLTAGTFNTEFALNCGYYLPATGTSAQTYATNVYPQSLANVFRRNGYTANSYHQLDGHFYNREVVHLTWGYESYNDWDDLQYEGSEYLDTALTQPDVYAKIVHDEPFVSYVITYSGHGPYNTAVERSQIISESHLTAARQIAAATGVTTANADTWSQYQIAIAHAMETDEMIGQLIENMTADGHIDDTVILFFGDHYSKYLTDTEFVMDLKGAWDMNSICRTPFFIYSKDLGEHIEVTKTTASADMLPTLLNLMGFAYDPTYYAGSDAFSEYGGFVVFRDYSWYDGTTWWTPYDDPETETEEIREMSRVVREYINASWDTIKTNYFLDKDLTPATS